MHNNSLLLFKKYAKKYFTDNIKVLEIGPTGFPSAYQRLVTNSNIKWDTLDITKDERLTYPESPSYNFPIESESYDIILAGQVFEHVPKIWKWMTELSRVVKSSGHIIIISPVSWRYHEAPIDCWRAHPEGMKALCEDAGFEIEVCLSESIEGKDFKRLLPGVGLDCQGIKRRIVWSFLGLFGFPKEASIDLITIAKKNKQSIFSD